MRSKLPWDFDTGRQHHVGSTAQVSGDGAEKPEQNLMVPLNDRPELFRADAQEFRLLDGDKVQLARLIQQDGQITDQPAGLWRMEPSFWISPSSARPDRHK